MTENQTVWVLTPNDDRESDDLPDPWSPWYDKAFGFVIRAESEEKARELAQENAGDETTVSPVHHDVDERVRGREVWKDSALADCVPVEEYGGENAVLMQDFARA